MYLLLISFVLGRFLYLLTIPLIDSGSIDNSNESGHLNNPRDGMDWKRILNSRVISISYIIRPFLPERGFPIFFSPLFEKWNSPIFKDDLMS